MPKSPKITLKSVTTQFETFREAMRKYVYNMRYPEAIQHSATAVLAKKGDTVGKAVITIEELVTTVRAGEVLGYDTILRANETGPNGPILKVFYTKNRANVPVPEELHA